MPSFHQVKILPYSSELLFNLVLAVEDYPKFLPWCHSVRIISHDQQQQQIITEVTIKFKVFTEQYQSRIIYTTTPTGHYIIDVEAISGPFKYLHNKWQFYQEHDNNSVIDFSIDFQFRSLLLDKLIGAFFYRAIEKMIDAFEKRALFLSNASRRL